MAERWPRYFSRGPEAIKAVLMVSADRDVVMFNPKKRYSDYRFPDEPDGAGIPSAQRVQEIMDNGRIQAGLLENRLFSGRERDLTPSFHLGPGETVRGVVAWSPCHHAGHETLAVNLNLYLVGQSDEGHAVFIEAASFDNEYEIIEYVALPGQGEPGTYPQVRRLDGRMLPICDAKLRLRSQHLGTVVRAA